jgi:branched-subunit amino acid aminotransferase/4-amino-4-deoxychorismate lyase
MLTYLNGQFVDEAEAVVPVRDRGFLLGDAVFDTWRTYGGRPCRAIVERHLARFRRSLTYMELDGDAIVEEIDAATTELVERNAAEIADAGDVLLFSIVSRGVTPPAIAGVTPYRPTRVTICNPIPFRSYGGDLHGDGAKLHVSSQVRSPFGYDPRVKSTSRLGYVRAERKQARSGTGAYVALFDDAGNIVEAVGAAICIVENGTIFHPPSSTALPSVSLTTFCDLARRLGVPVEQRPLTPFDLLNADETFVLSTSIAFLPVIEFDGIPLKRAGVVERQVLDAWIDLVGFDFVAQGRELAQRSGAEVLI